MTLPEAIERRHKLIAMVAKIEEMPHEKRRQCLVEKNRLLGELRELKQWIKSQHRQQKMCDIALFKALVEILDRAEESGFVLTADDQSVLDDTVNRIEAIEAYEAP